ncbi:MAG: hypothetical protein EP332_10095 [Bacteroidetes bacterium]|nr:MAG: hypothetical protein EP332_10095 [Bacteroidota bacterium]
MQENESTNMNAAQEPKRDNMRVVLIILLLLSIILNLYQYYDKGKQAEGYDETIDSLTIDMNEVERQFQLTKAELEQFRGKYVQVDSLLNVANSDLETKKAEIEALLKKGRRSAAETQRLKSQIEEYKSQMEKYVEQIDMLIQENQKLRDQNDSLNNELSTSNASRNNLQARLKLAEQIRVDRVSVTNYKKRLIGGKLTSTSLARRTVKSDVCFTVLENAVAERGKKLISLRILAPNGKPLAGASNGNFQDNVTGESLTATGNNQIDFDGTSQELCLAWEGEEGELEPGNYQIEIYIEGVLVFTSTFTLE